MGIDLLKRFKLLLCVKAIIADGAPDGQIVFLFNKAIVILVIGAAAGEGDLMIGPSPNRWTQS